MISLIMRKCEICSNIQAVCKNFFHDTGSAPSFQLLLSDAIGSDEVFKMKTS
ncbi:hypothetical protein L917_04945 [Phytophthora nicotianae]|uniref:Uncharacterized protein n=1 Tax=Phytophthora nicotianae TaxID=4792 RepID=W2LMA0_PHYNI|nr:hypothetical protein L917_04945 [Phytophthora nicotianae]